MNHQNRIEAGKNTVALLALVAFLAACGESTWSPPATPGPTPTGGGGDIVFASNRDGNYELYTMNAVPVGLLRDLCRVGRGRGMMASLWCKGRITENRTRRLR